MRTFAQKHNQPQKPVSSNLTRSHTATPGLHHRADLILPLQRAIGNQAVQRMLQTNAEELKAGLTGTASPHFGHGFSRIPIHPPAAGAIQTKLAINEPGDIYEQEADRVSEQVMRMPEPQLQRACACGGGCPRCQTEQPGSEHEYLQTKHVQPSESGQTEAPPLVHEVLASPGQSLDTATRTFFEPRFGHDFSRVRVHTDTKAAESAIAVNALAYTVGRDVVFGAGQFVPGTSEGRRLLAHELTHVIQQSGAEPNKGVQRTRISSITPPLILQRQIVTGCMAPSEIPGISDSRASSFGQIAEGVITVDYCSKMGCAPFATDYLDNPITSSYIAFLGAHNPHLTATDIATLAILSQIELNRPDILTHKPGREEFEEIKPNSVSGRAAGALKVGTLIGFYGIWSLPYVPGATYVPTPEILLATAPGSIEVFLRIQRQAPGLVVYDICIRGDKTALTIAAIIAILLLVIAIYLSRGRILQGAPIPISIPALAAAGVEGAGETEGRLATGEGVERLPSMVQAKLILGEPSDRFEQEADAIAAQVMEVHP